MYQTYIDNEEFGNPINSLQVSIDYAIYHCIKCIQNNTKTIVSIKNTETGDIVYEIGSYYIEACYDITTE